MNSAHIVLLRAIGGATHAKMTMKQLEAKLQNAGFPETRSILATGNFVVRSGQSAEEIAKVIAGFLSEAGIKSVVFMRTHQQLLEIVSANPFADASEGRPSQYQVTFTERRPSDEAIAALIARCHGERIARIGDEIAIDYNGRISDSKVLPAVVDRILGCAATGRNWNTVMKLLEVSA
jgi:uncharacterized protein (DUF1697 family)